MTASRDAARPRSAERDQTQHAQVEILLVEDNDVELTLHALRHDELAGQVHMVGDGAAALDFLSYTIGANSYIVKSADSADFTRAAQHICLYWLQLNEVPQGG